MKKILSLLILFSFSYPLELQSKPKGRTYAPEEGTFDRRKRIVIERKCRLIKNKRFLMMLYVHINHNQKKKVRKINKFT